jgi:hypothetical protein
MFRMPFDSSTTSTKKQAGRFGGALPTDSMMRSVLGQWLRANNNEFEIVGRSEMVGLGNWVLGSSTGTTCIPATRIFTQTGCVVELLPRQLDPSKQLSFLLGPSSQGQATTGEDADEGTDPLQSGKVTLQPVTADNNLAWFFKAHDGDISRSTSDELVAVINGFNVLLKQRQFQAIDQVFRTAKLSQLSPEKMVALARITFPVRTLLNEWQSFVRRAHQELQSRHLDATIILKGLV